MVFGRDSLLVRLAAVVVLATVLVLSNVAPVGAATRTATLTPGEQAKSFASFAALSHCLRVGWFRNSTQVGPIATKNSDIGADRAVKWEWFFERVAQGTPVGNVYGGIPPLPPAAMTDNSATVGVINEPDDGDVNCADSGWLKAAGNFWGYTSAPELLCALGFTREVNTSPSKCTEIVSGANNNFKAPANPVQKLNDLWTKTLGGSSNAVDSINATGGAYRLYLDSFKAGCSASAGGSDFRIWEYNETTKKGSQNAYSLSSRDQGDVRVYQGTTMSCQALAAKISIESTDIINGYKKWLKDNPNSDDTTTSGRRCDLDDTCAAETSCNIEGGLGWILCPLLTTGAGLADDAYRFLADNFLALDTSLLNTDPNATTVGGQKVGTGTYTAWKIMQQIGNAAFIIAFLVIIFSQLTSVGVSNYGVKKMLPRLIVAAILVNLSFIICQVAVDVSNIAGYSLKGLFSGIAEQVTASGGGSAVSTTDDSSNLGGIVALVIVGAGFAWINIGALIIAIVGALVSLLTIFVLLVVRKVLIVLLIVIAPLAFVAYLLPNTEPLFQKWRKALTAMLLLFPIIGLLYGACLLASAILLQVAGDDVVLKIAAYMALVVPLIAVIPILKGSMDGIGKIGASIQSFGQKAGGAARGKAQTTFDNSRLGQFKKYREGAADQRRARIQSGTYQGRGGKANPLNWFAGVNRGLNRASGRFGQRLTATGDALANTEDAELMKNADARIGSMSFTGADGKVRPLSTAQLIQLARKQDVTDASGNVVAKAGQFDEHSRRAAILRAASVANVPEAHDLLNGSGSMSKLERKTLAEGFRSAGVVAKAPWLSGTTLGLIEQGGLTAEEATMRAVADGKLTAEALAAGDDASAGHLVQTLSDRPSDSTQVQAEKARLRAMVSAEADKIYAPGSHLGEKVTAGSQKEDRINQMTYW